MWCCEWLGPNYLDYWPFGILIEKAILSLPLQSNKGIIGNASLRFYSGFRWNLGRVNRCLSSCNTTVYSSSAKNRVYLNRGPLLYGTSTWCKCEYMRLAGAWRCACWRNKPTPKRPRTPPQTPQPQPTRHKSW